MRAAFLLPGLFIFIIISATAFAEFTMVNDVNCNGKCTVTQSYNGESVEVVSSGRTSITTHAENGEAEMVIDSTGQGEVRMNLNNMSGSHLNVVSGSGNSGEISHPYLNTTFNSRENTPDVSRNASNYTGKNETSFNHSESDNYVCSDSAKENNCSNSNRLGNISHRAIEVNSDGAVENTETEGIFQKVYKFFQSFSARIFWS